MQTTRVVETIVKLWLYFTNEISIKDLLPFRIFNIFHHYCIQIVVRIVSSKFSEWKKKKKKKIYCPVQSINFQFKGKYLTLSSPPGRLIRRQIIGGMKFIGLSGEWFLTKKTSVHDIKPNFIPLVWARAFDDKSFQRETQRDRQGNNRKRRGSVQETRFQATPGTISSKILQISGPWFFFFFFSSDFFYPSLRYHRRSI